MFVSMNRVDKLRLFGHCILSTEIRFSYKSIS